MSIQARNQVTSAPPYSIRIFVATGDPEKLRIVEKANWNGVGFVFPRLMVQEVRELSELRFGGVYILWGGGESDDLPCVYVGLSDEIPQRLYEHNRTKGFWTHGVVFVSRALNRAHFSYIEYHLVRLAKLAQRCELDNDSHPVLPQLSDMDKADANLYLSDMLLCLPLLGIQFFEESVGAKETHPILKLDGRGITAQGYYVDPRHFIVKAGSQVTKDIVPSAPSRVDKKRKELRVANILVEEEDILRLSEDVEFKSPSGASDFLLGSSSNGWTAWKDENGKPLADYRDDS